MAKVILGGAEESAFLTSLPFQHICFTGGTGIGRKVMLAAANNLTSVTLELGGKSPAIVDATVHVADAAKRLAWGKFLNSGQVCISPDYLLVEDAIADAVIKEFVTQIQSMYGTSPKDQLSCVQRSRMVNDHHFKRVVGLIEDALAQGARVVTGGTWDASARRIAPTVLEDVTLDMAIMQEEIFGPVLPIIRWDKEEDLKRVLRPTPTPWPCTSSRRTKPKWHAGWRNSPQAPPQSMRSFFKWRNPSCRLAGFKPAALEGPEATWDSKRSPI